MQLFSIIAGLIADIFAMLRGVAGAGAMSAMGRRIFGAAFKVLPGVAIQLLLFFGLTLGVNHFAVDPMRDVIANQFDSIPDVWIQFVALTRIDQAVTVLLSAMAISLSRKIRLKPATGSLLY